MIALLDVLQEISASIRGTRELKRVCDVTMYNVNIVYIYTHV